MSVITIIRTGKRPALSSDVETPREAFEQMNVPASMYESWHITNTATGDTVGLNDRVGDATLICGDRVEGA